MTRKAGLVEKMSREDHSLSPSEIIDGERAQIGHDLHDLLLPLVFAASANLQSVLRQSKGDQIGDAELAKVRDANDWLHQAMQTGRGLLTQIYPPELEQIGWLAATKGTVRRLTEENSISRSPSEISCEVMWTISSDSPVADPNWEIAVANAAYRVVVESVRNAIAHGKAESIAIRCSADSIAIVDDGSGFDVSAVAPTRFGIRSMKGRARLVGQEVTVESEIGGPTKVTFILSSGE